MGSRPGLGSALAAMLLAPALAGAQSSDGAAPAPLRVGWSAEAIVLDGVPAEPVWFTTDSIVDFTQRDPDEGRAATERTVVRLLATGRGLYVGLWAYDSAPERIRRAQLRRDADFDSDDSFTILLDPLRDHRSGYVFGVNPNGALYDAEVLNFENVNDDWNGVWDARARVTSFGWTAEIFIPWQTLRYAPSRTAWGVNFRRRIRRKNEEVLWRAWARTEGLLFQDREGTLTGFSGLPRRGLAELRPYTAATVALRQLEYRADGSDSILALASPLGDVGKLGLDAKVAVAATVTLDLTANTDFAQVEADRQVVNLTRFPLFFPEKRPFFLEASGIFDFGQSERSQVFYSRRIGLSAVDGSTIPLDAGARLTGRVGSERIGLLALRTGAPENAVDLVARLKHDVVSRGYVGGIVTSQSGPGVAGDRLAVGADFNVPLLVRGQNLVFGGYLAGTRDSTAAPTRRAWRLLVDYPNDFMDNFLGVSRIEPGFDPALGFVQETDAVNYRGAFRIYPRPNRLGIRKFLLKPIEWDVTTHLDGTLSHAFYAISPLGARFETGDEFQFELQRLEDDPPGAFEIFPGDTIAAGRYRYDRAELGFSSSAGRPFGFDVGVSAGDFYTGTSTAVETALTLRAARHVIANLEVAQQAVRLATRRFTARTARVRVDVATTPRLGGTLFLQWDDESDRLALNARLHWIPTPGSDAYLVWNSAWPTGLDRGIPWQRPQRGAIVGKVVYYFRL